MSSCSPAVQAKGHLEGLVGLLHTALAGVHERQLQRDGCELGVQLCALVLLVQQLLPACTAPHPGSAQQSARTAGPG